MSEANRASFCENCGSALHEQATFCSNCGTVRSAANPGSGVASAPARPRRTPLIVAAAVVVVLALVGGAVAIAASAGDDETAKTPPTTRRPSTTVTTIATTTSTTPPTTALPEPTELQRDWNYEPDRCNVDASPKPYPHSSTRTYEVTATIGLWSGASTDSQRLAIIPVTTFGPGGIGCPDGLAPKVTITCKVSRGETIIGPFGNDPIWLRTTFNGITGYVPDQWVDTEWDVASIGECR